jgi:S-disulfanyl-L-cysteine oxidoreductase SoxD
MDTKHTKRLRQKSSFVPLVSVVAALVTATAVAQDRHTSVWDGVYTDSQADRGLSLYDRHCAGCHGRYLEGVPAAPPDAEWLRKPSLSGWEFRRNWNQLSLGDLFERVRISMPQNAIGSLNRQQVADLLAYLLRQNGYPSGRLEMTGEKPLLDEIKISGW